jgi:hypothetical protein
VSRKSASRAAPALRGAIDLLAGEAGTSAGPGADAATSALLDLLLVYIVRAWYEEQPAAPPPDAPRVVGLRGQ